MPDGSTGRYRVEVADEDSNVIYRATLDFRAWIGVQLDGEAVTVEEQMEARLGE